VIFELPRAATRFSVQHIPSVMALCRSKKPNIHPTADAPIETQQIEDSFRKFCEKGS